MTGANLQGAQFRGAHPEGAILTDVRLEGADFRGAHLEEALADEGTRWPVGFDWHAAGVIVVGEDAATSPPQQA
jgi:FixJ family two-component response regulator